MYGDWSNTYESMQHQQLSFLKTCNKTLTSGQTVKSQVCHAEVMLLYQPLPGFMSIQVPIDSAEQTEISPEGM